MNKYGVRRLASLTGFGVRHIQDDWSKLADRASFTLLKLLERDSWNATFWGRR